MIVLTSGDDGVLLPVHAQPSARRDGITGEHDGRLKVACTQAPEKGKANKALIKVLANSLQLKRSQVHLHSGETSSKKVFLITDIAVSDLEQRIAAVLVPGRD
jgi:uncharacterized protein